MIAISVQEVCARLGCKERQVFYLLKKGILERAPRFGREIRIYLDTVERAQARPEPMRARRRTRRETLEAPIVRRENLVIP